VRKKEMCCIVKGDENGICRIWGGSIIKKKRVKMMNGTQRGERKKVSVKKP
jgi:hypothetical protein